MKGRRHESLPGRPKGEYRSAQHGGFLMSATESSARSLAAATATAPAATAPAPANVTANAARQAGRMARYQGRRWVNRIALVFSLAAMAFGVFWLLWILFETARLGLGGLSWSLFSEMTPAPQAETGGLANAIAGSALMVLLATCLGTPIGVLAGIYLAEYGKGGWLANTVRFVNDILLSAPSIVIGLFIYALVVTRMKSFSGIAGVLALALIVIPVVIRTTENMLLLIPNTLRESAYALGTPKWKVILSITLKASRAGVLTGVLLAVARITGETAPLLFTALSNQFWSLDLSQPMTSLPVTIFKFAMSPYENWQKLAWAGVFLITLGVLALNILARVLFKNKH
jgi:phosphate transport system permease protein